VTYYDLLGVTASATPEQIRAAYRSQAMRWHPDRNPGSKESEEKFKQISEAYAVLHDSSARTAYDAALANDQAYTFHEQRIDPEAAASMFMQEMMALALELTVHNVKWPVIAQTLADRGCPEGIAISIAQSVEAQRKSVVRKSAGKSLLVALVTIAIGTVVSLISYHLAAPGGIYVVATGAFLYGAYNIIRALYFLATGRVPGARKIPQPKPQKKIEIITPAWKPAAMVGLGILSVLVAPAGLAVGIVGMATKGGKRRGQGIALTIASLLVSALIVAVVLSGGLTGRSVSTISSAESTVPVTTGQSQTSPLAPTPTTSESPLLQTINAAKEKNSKMETELNGLEAQLQALSNQMKPLKVIIDDYKSKVEAGETVDRSDYQSQLDSYNSLVDQYNGLLQTYKAEYAEYSSQIDQINQMVRQYNSGQ
jgi:hypothetical protein